MKVLKRVFTGEIKGIDEKERTLTAYISTKDRDRMDESLLPEGADLKQFNKNPVVLFGHDYGSPPIGKALWTRKDSRGIISKVKFANTEFASEIFGLYKEGFMNAFSVGFIPTEVIDGDGKKTPRRTYKSWELLEFSAVPVPANPEALTLAMQKGILKDEGLIKSLEESGNAPAEEENKDDKTVDKTDEEKPAEEDVTADDKTTSEDSEDDKTDDKGKEEAPAEEKGFDELTGEVEHYKQMAEGLEKENTELREKVFALLQEKQKDTLLEMTDEDIVKKIDGIFAGVIRQAQGKIN